MTTPFAQVDKNSFVVNIILATQTYVDKLPKDFSYVQAWEDADGQKDKRYNYPRIGYTYDSVAGAFIAPCPGANYVLDTNTYKWVLSTTGATLHTLNTAALRLAKVTFLTVPTTNAMLTDESREALNSYIAKVTIIASTAQAALSRGEAYQPEFPPETTLNTNAPVFKGVGAPVVLQFKPDTVERFDDNQASQQMLLAAVQQTNPMLEAGK